jgi:MATE family multidrug resistance protein
MFWEELFVLAKYALPVFGYVHLIIAIHIFTPPSTHVLEYSLVVVSVVSIGHLSTSALAAISLGSMTASVSGFSIIQGMANALDTLLPSAWTSPHPELVGLWSQRMSEFFVSILKKAPLIDHHLQPSL